MYLNSNIVFSSTHIGNEQDTPSYLDDLILSSDLIILENENMIDRLNLQIKQDAVILYTYPKIFNNFNFDELSKENQFVLDGLLKSVTKTFHEYANKGLNIILLSDEGSSIIADFGNYFRNYCIINNIAYKVMPGPSAVINSLCSSGYIGGLDIFTFYGPRFSKTQIDAFINIINNEMANTPGIIFINQKNCLYLIDKLIDKLGDISAWLCIGLTTNHESVIGNTLSKIKEHIETEPNALKYKSSIVFANKSLDLNHVYR